MRTEQCFLYTAPMAIILMSSGVRGAISRLAGAAWPEEGCGVLCGRQDGGQVHLLSVHACRNVAADRRRRFELEPLDYLAAERAALAAGQEVVGIWHSHPDGRAVPSETDREMAWGGWCYVIAATRQQHVTTLRAWRLVDAEFVEEVIES